MTQELNWQDVIAAVTEEDARTTATAVAAAFDDRMTFEHRERPGNESIQTKLKAARAKLTALTAATVLKAAQVDPGFVNRSLTEGRRYNIYAVDKLADLVQGLEKGGLRNAVNLAMLQSLFRFQALNEPFTGQMAIAATSDKVKVPAKLAKVLVRHSVSAQTAPTQTSSTMSALQTLGIVANIGTAKAPIWQLTETPATQRAAEVVQAA